MKKGQRYQQLGQQFDKDDISNTNSSAQHSFEPYRDEIPEVPPSGATINRALSSSSASSVPEHPLTPSGNTTSVTRAKGILRSKSTQSPPRTRSSGSRSPLRRRAPSRENSFQNASSNHSHHHLDPTLGGLVPDIPLPPLRHAKDDKDSDSCSSSKEGSPLSHPAILEDDHANGDDRPQQGLWNAQSLSSGSFDLLDDEDELDLQRYHVDVESSNPWDPEGHEWDPAARTYEPANNSNGKPWISMVQSNSGNLSSPSHPQQLSFLQSAKEFWMYLHALRRQARQRRAQRLLTMPNERWWQRLQFCIITYCWDATDVGLMVVAILFALWFLGLIWYSYLVMNQRHHKNTNTSNQEAESQGAEYSGNAPYDKANENSTWQSLFQWWWWGLGMVLLVRILGPLAVQRVDVRRRNRRRRRFESDNMERQRQLQQQQQHEERLQQQGSSSPGRAHPDFAYPAAPLAGLDDTGPTAGGADHDSSSSSSYMDGYEDEEDHQPSVEMS